MPQPNSHEQFLRKKRNKKLFRIGLIIFLILFFIGSLSYISHRPRIRISKVTVSGNSVISEKEIVSASLGYITGSYFWLFPKNNFLLYPRADLEKYLKEKFPRIDTVSVHQNNFNTLSVSLTERSPAALWCNVTEHCYFMDPQSFVFAGAPDFSGSVYFKYYGLLGTSTPIGNWYIASTTEFADIGQFVQTVRSLSLAPVSLKANGDDTFSLILQNSAQIYFDMTDSLSKTAQNLEALIRTPALSQNLSKLEYIDLRFGNKLYYKLK